MNSIFPEWLVGNSDSRLAELYRADPSLARAMTEDELAEYQFRQMRSMRGATADDVAKWHCRMTAYGHVVENRMKDKGEIVYLSSRIHEGDMPDSLIDVLDNATNDEVVSVDLLSTDTVQTVRDKTQAAIDLRKSTISKLFNKLCAILSAACKWLFDLLTVKK